MFVIVNTISAFVVLRNIISILLICIYYFLTGILLLINMFVTIQVQTLLEVQYFPTGIQILDGMSEKWKNENKVCSSQKLQVDNIKYYSQYTESLKLTNDKRATKLKKAYKYFMFATLGVTLGFFIFLILIA